MYIRPCDSMQNCFFFSFLSFFLYILSFLLSSLPFYTLDIYSFFFFSILSLILSLSSFLISSSMYSSSSFLYFLSGESSFSYKSSWYFTFLFSVFRAASDRNPPKNWTQNLFWHLLLCHTKSFDFAANSLSCSHDIFLYRASLLFWWLNY